MRTSSVLALGCFLFTIVGTFARPERYAVLVATSKGYLFYRHQATLAHAYHTLLANGFKKDNIITMFYDDIVNHPKNPDKGQLRNQPNGTNYYLNLKKDYTGEKVNADVLYAVLTGDEKTAKGPVLKSKAKDYVFVYIVGFGGFSFIGFPSGPPLTANKFMEAIKKLRTDKKARKVFVNLETPMAASLVNGLVPRKNNIFISTATNFDEYPAACYCIKELKTCYGSLYGCAWTERSDRLRQLKSGMRTTLFDQFNIVRTMVPLSQVNMWGHLEMGTSRLRDFLGYKLVPKKKTANRGQSPMMDELALAALDEINESESEENEQQIDALLEYLGAEDDTKSKSNMPGKILHQHEVPSAFMEEETNSDGQPSSSIEENREFVKQTMQDIYEHLASSGVNISHSGTPVAPLSDETAHIYNEAINKFSSICFNINENTFVHGELGKLAVLAANNIPLDDQIKAMQSVCTDKHQMAASIH